MAKDVILTGIRANDDLHIGHYFGVILPTIDMSIKHSDKYDINLFIPDLHSFTTPIDHSKLHGAIMNNARIYAAAGLPLDKDSIHMYRQSYVPAHSEMTVILNNFVGFGEMERMTQFKDKSAKLSGDRVSVGIFDYPVLMASDILLYNARYVPVGDDQTQHLEITRDIALRMNNRFGELFVVPVETSKQHELFGKKQGLRIKDLLDPTKKMSKSDESGKGVLFLNDTPEASYKKIMSATTDDKAHIRLDKQNQPGISNLLEILALVRQANGVDTSIDKVEMEFEGMTRYGDFKKIVAEETVALLSSLQSKLAAVDMTLVNSKLCSSEESMRLVANATLYKVQQAVGLRPKA